MERGGSVLGGQGRRMKVLFEPSLKGNEEPSHWVLEGWWESVLKYRE